MTAETGAEPVGPLRRPRLADGVRLHGELVGSAFAERQWLAERGGQFLQMSGLLYRVAELSNGERSPAQIADELSAGLPWRLTADQVRWLILTKLAPAGVVEEAAPAGAAPAARRAAAPSPLAVTLRLAVVGPDLIDPLARVLQRLYAPAALAGLLAAALAAHAWLYLGHGVAAGLEQTLRTPGLLLAMLGLVVLSTAFHELGHAAALRRGGGRARGIGVGFYLIYPAFYTDVTDTYRLGRWARVRTDLGGFYFNLLFTLGLFALHGATGWEFPLLAVLLIDLEILHQLLPFGRLDGYWLLADLTGVPDFFSQTGAFLRSLLPERLAPAWRGPRLPRLKPWARAVFGLYTVLVVPWLVVSLWLFLKGVPRVVATTWDAWRLQERAFAAATAAADPLGAATAAAQMLLLGLTALGLAVFLVSLARAAVGAFLRLPFPVVHRAAAALLLALLLSAALGWRPAGAYAGAPRPALARQHVAPADGPPGPPRWVAALVRTIKRQLLALAGPGGEPGRPAPAGRWRDGVRDL